MMPVRQTLSKPDIQLSYLEWNQGQEPLLLLHGLGDHALVWSSLGDDLASRLPHSCTRYARTWRKYQA